MPNKQRQENETGEVVFSPTPNAKEIIGEILRTSTDGELSKHVVLMVKDDVAGLIADIYKAERGINKLIALKPDGQRDTVLEEGVNEAHFANNAAKILLEEHFSHTGPDKYSDKSPVISEAGEFNTMSEIPLYETLVYVTNNKNGIFVEIGKTGNSEDTLILNPVKDSEIESNESKLAKAKVLILDYDPENCHMQAQFLANHGISWSNIIIKCSLDTNGEIRLPEDMGDYDCVLVNAMGQTTDWHGRVKKIVKGVPDINMFYSVPSANEFTFMKMQDNGFIGRGVSINAIQEFLHTVVENGELGDRK